MLNEKSYFSLPDVKAEFNKYTLLKLFTDTVPLEYYPLNKLETVTVDVQEADADKHKTLQREKFNTAELPLYVVIEPTETGFKEIGRYSVGLIRDKDEFLRFLRDPASDPRR